MDDPELSPSDYRTPIKLVYSTWIGIPVEFRQPQGDFVHD